MTVQARTPLISRDAPWSEVRDALAQAQKSNRNAQAYSRWVNRPLGRVLAATAYRWGVSPNGISVASACLTFPAIVLIAVLTPAVWSGVLIAVLLVLGYALDSADGQVARLGGGGSLAGEWLDHMLDAFKTSSFHLAVAIMWFRNLEGWSVVTTLVPLAFALQASVWFFGIILTDQLLRGAGVRKAQPRSGDEPAPIVTSLLGIPVDYGVLCLAMGLLGWFPLWRMTYVVLAALNVALLFVQLVRWYRRISAVGSHGGRDVEHDHSHVQVLKESR